MPRLMAGVDLRLPAPGQARKVAILDHLFDPQPGRQTESVVLVEDKDNGPIHTSKRSVTACPGAYGPSGDWLCVSGRRFDGKRPVSAQLNFRELNPS